MDPAVIIPVYLSSRRRTGAGPVLTTYDHATPLSQEGELPRCLDSLRKVRGLGHIIILAVAEGGIENQAAGKVYAIADRFPDLDITVIGAPEMALILQRMEQLGIPCRREVALAGYGAVRNVGLIAAAVLGFDSVVFLDDDSVVEDEGFLEKAMYGLGKLTPRGIPILAKTGFYLNENDSYLSRHKSKWYNRFWDQGAAFNDWISAAMRGPRLSRSSHVCGGCMALHREALRRVAFDPWIARGEDLDYMINLRIYGSDIWFDNQWFMRHLPPEKNQLSEGLRFRQDIFRWLYEFRKIEYGRTQIDLQPIKPASLQPYPGPFLEPGVHKRIRRTALLRSIGRPDGKGYRRAAKSAAGEAEKYAEDNCMKYFEFQYKWPTIMSRMEHDAMLKNALLESDSRRRAQAARRNAGDAAAVRNPGMGAAARQAAAPLPARPAPIQLDAGKTTQIHLDMGNNE